MVSALLSKRLLVVEDDVGMRRLLVKALSNEMRDVLDAADGEEAIRCLRREPPFDLVVSDVKMPNKDGNAVLREVSQNHPGTKVILITAFGEVDEYLEAMDSGAFEDLTKPLKLVDLTRVVNRALVSDKPSKRSSPPAL